jgi:hypothetical protein
MLRPASELLRRCADAVIATLSIAVETRTAFDEENLNAESLMASLCRNLFFF